MDKRVISVRRRCAIRAVFVATLLAITASFPAFATTESRLTVVELYTSQGCSSCPPADALLGRLAKRQDILALTLPVTYWDYLGWTDKFAKPAHDARQRDYARRYSGGRVYTPQIVIDGLHREIGSHAKAVEAVIAIQQGSRKPVVPVLMTQRQDTFSIEIGEGVLPAGAPHATIWFIRFIPKREVAVRGGENSGKHITYTNIVEELSPIGMWQGDSLQIQLPREDIGLDGDKGIAVLVQLDGTGEIIGAGSFQLSSLVN